MEKLNQKAINDVLDTSPKIRAEALYKFLVEGLSHRKIEKLMPDLTRNHGWSSWKIAKFFGFRDSDKGKFSVLDFTDLVLQIEKINLNEVAEFHLNENHIDGNQLDDSSEGKDIFRELKVRVGQVKLRSKIIKYYNGKCALCNIKMKDILVASHIKSWSTSSQTEKVDPSNAILLCKLHDGLFDRGHISLDDNFNVIYKNKEMLESHGISVGMVFTNPIDFLPGLKYLSDHRKKFNYKN